MSSVDELPRPLRRALQAAGHELATPYTRRIFTNREAAHADQTILGQTGSGLWSRDTAFGDYGRSSNRPR